MYYNSILIQLIIIASISSSIILSVNGISCWDCNSYYHPDCKDPFKNGTFGMMDCSMHLKAHLGGKSGTICRKTIQKVDNEHRYIRGCGWLEDDSDPGVCIKRSGTFSVLIEYCQCKDGDGCNGANEVTGNKAALIGAVLSLLILKYTL